MGMVQPRTSGNETVSDDGAIYDVGCLGRISSFEETDDGRYMIVLTGIARFRIIEELPLEAEYRCVRAEFGEFKENPPITDSGAYDRTQFMQTLNGYMSKLGAEEGSEQRLQSIAVQYIAFFQRDTRW